MSTKLDAPCAPGAGEEQVCRGRNEALPVSPRELHSHTLGGPGDLSFSAKQHLPLASSQL